MISGTVYRSNAWYIPTIVATFCGSFYLDVIYLIAIGLIIIWTAPEILAGPRTNINS